MKWISDIIDNDASFFLTGDALYSLVHPRTGKKWSNILKRKSNRLIIDEVETIINGLQINISGKGNTFLTLEFWNQLLGEIKKIQQLSDVAYLQLSGPYFDRNSVYCIRLLEACDKNQVHSELYLYLDGHHLAHTDQNPSAFQNIEKSLQYASRVFSCERCAMARGYLKKSDITNSFFTPNTVKKVRTINLTEIVKRFPNVRLLSSNSIITYPDSFQTTDKKLTYLVTHPPYSTEFCFGAVSIAIACAQQGIRTDVIFIEDGIYSLTGKHQISEEDSIFNVQDIINSTAEEPNLRYFYYEPSLKIRSMEINPSLKCGQEITEHQLGELLNADIINEIILM